MSTTIKQPTESDRQYVLGHSERELERLDQQGAFWAEATERWLLDAGLAPGMRVLDVGCGTGDVTLLAARIVGPTGFVVGIDRAPEAVETSRQRAESHGLTQVAIRQADLMQDLDADLDGFDAVIGRFLLMHLPDPVAALRRLTARVRPGGIVAFQDYDFSVPTVNEPSLPLGEKVTDWVVLALQLAGVEVRMGLRYRSVFRAAGLPAPTVRTVASFEGPEDPTPFVYLAETARSLLPAIEQAGLATAEEVGIDTLAERLHAEALAVDSCMRAPDLAGAWSRRPPAR